MTELEMIMNAHTKGLVTTLATAFLCLALPNAGHPDSLHEPTLTPAISHPMGEGALATAGAGEGKSGRFMATEQVPMEQGTSPEPPSTPTPTPLPHPVTGQWLGAVQEGFIPNVGQVPNPAVRFALRHRGVSAYFTDQGFVLWNGQTTTVMRDGTEVSVPVAPRWELVGARRVEPVGGRAFDHTVSCFRGNDPAKWRANVPAFRDLRYPQILDGVELRVESRERGIEYSFHLQPHAKPDLRFRYDGITALETSLTGDLIVRTATGHFTESRPVSYQLIEGVRRGVASSFEIVSPTEYRIAVGAYDARHALIVDPVLDWSTSVGGAANDSLNVVKVDPTGDVVVAGVSFSMDLPITSGFGPFGTDAGVNFGSDQVWHTDVYIAKFSADGTQLLWAGYLGGEGATSESIGRNKTLAIDHAGDVYITTHTRSTDFPVWPPGSSFHQGEADASITKIKSDGSEILWSRLLGAPAEDYGYAVAVHGTDLYLAGITASPNFHFPVTARSFAGMQDAFVAKLDAADGTVVWSSFLGGSLEERISGIVADANGVIVFGDTDSADFHAPDFPAPTGHDRNRDGSNDAFLTKFASDGGILWSTYLGGSEAETTALAPFPQFPRTWGFTDIAMDSVGGIVAAGQTWSPDFPNTAGRFQSSLAGVNDAYVAKLTPDGLLLWATYLGGTGPQNSGGLQDGATGVAINPWDEILVGGVTISPYFPTTADALKPAMPADGFQDGFLVKLNQNGQQLLYSTYIGNTGWHDAILALDYGFGKVVACGWHLDTFFQITAGTFRQECNNCGSEAFLMNFLDAFVAHDGFESGNYSGGTGWPGNWTASGDASILTSSGPHSGSRHVRLRSSTGYLQRTVNVPPGSITLQLGFWAKVNSFEGSDRADVLARSTGANFTTVASFTPAQSDNNYHYYEIDLTSFLDLASFPPATQIHIALDAAMNASNDNLYLDDIRLTGTTGVVDQPPTIDITSPFDGAVVSAIVTITADANDDVGVTTVTWLVDGNPMPANTWDTTTASEGTHTIAATATDTAGQTAADSISVTVDNVNDLPTAQAGPDQAAYVGDAVGFSGLASSDPDGTITSYSWDFGDGTGASGATGNHAYTAPGVYSVTLTVTDNDGAVDSDTAEVTVTDPPSEVEVFYDSFEVSEWNSLWTEDSQNDWFRSTQRATQGSRSAEVDGSANNASLTSALTAINLQGRTSATITFDWYIESGLDSGEYLEFHVSTNGGATWTPKAILRGNADPENSWRSVTVEMAGISQLRLQFRGQMNDSSEDANVDNVRVVAY